MKNEIKRRWKVWCDKVYEHNRRLGYVYMEEQWEPTTPLFPVVLALIFASFFAMAALCGIKIPIWIPVSFVLGTLVVFEFFLWCNWRCYEKIDERR